MRLSVAISTMNRPAELRRCLESLRPQTRRPDELVLIDAAGQPEVEALARSLEDAIPRVVYLSFRSSLTQARNRAVRESSGDVLVFIDDDLILEPDFLEQIAKPFELDAGCTLGGVTGDIINHPREVSGLKHVFKRLFLLPCDGDGRFRLSGAPTMVHGMTDERDVEFLPGGLTAWRREVFQEFLFDESLPGLSVNEDVDFSYRVSRRWKNRYAPMARVTHLRPSLEREARLRYLQLELRSAWYLYRKNLPKDPLHFAAFLWHQAGVLVRFAFRRWMR